MIFLILTRVITIKGERKKSGKSMVDRKVFGNFWTFDLRGEELIEIPFPFLFTFLNEKWKQ